MKAKKIVSLGSQTGIKDTFYVYGNYFTVFSFGTYCGGPRPQQNHNGHSIFFIYKSPNLGSYELANLYFEMKYSKRFDAPFDWKPTEEEFATYCDSLELGI
jgi:hypothetical protein